MYPIVVLKDNERIMGMNIVIYLEVILVVLILLFLLNRE